MESIGLKCIQLFPSHSQLKIVLIDVIHKKTKQKNSLWRRGCHASWMQSYWTECTKLSSYFRHLLPGSQLEGRNACSLSCLLCKILYFYLACLQSPAKVMNWMLQVRQAKNSENCTTYVKSRQCHPHLWPLTDKASQCLGLPFYNSGNLYLCLLPFP